MKNGVPEFGDLGRYTVNKDHERTAAVVHVHSSTLVAVVCEEDMSIRTQIQLGAGVNEFQPDTTLAPEAFAKKGIYRVDEKFSKNAIVFALRGEAEVCIVCEHELAFRTPVKVGTGVNEFQPDAQ